MDGSYTPDEIRQLAAMLHYLLAVLDDEHRPTATYQSLTAPALAACAGLSTKTFLNRLRVVARAQARAIKGKKPVCTKDSL